MKSQLHGAHFPPNAEPMSTDLSQATIQADMDVVDGAVEADLVLLDLRSSQYFRLNRTASALWAFIKTPRSFQEVCAELKDRYQLQDDVAQRDATVLIENLLAQGLVSVTHAHAS